MPMRVYIAGVERKKMMKTPYDKLKILSNRHWEYWDFKERITTREWKLVLLHNDDHIVFEGRIHPLVAKKLGYGVVEISKKALKG